VIDADIESFFDSVVHRKLIGMLREQIVDPRILKLISDYLKVGFQEVGKPWQERRAKRNFCW
jgi:retron-type reverse transcriptase